MTRQFEKPDYEAILKKAIQVGEALPESHLACFVFRVISLLDLESIYQQDAAVGGKQKTTPTPTARPARQRSAHVH